MLPEGNYKGMEMRGALGAFLLAVVACTPPSATTDDQQNGSSEIATEVAVGPPGLELGTPLTSLGQTGLEVTVFCFTTRETEPSYYSTGLDAQTSNRIRVAEIAQNLDRYFFGQFFGDVMIFDASCSVARPLSGTEIPLTPETAATLAPQEPMLQAFSNAVPLSQHLAAGGRLDISGRYDIGGSDVPMTVALSRNGIEAVILTLGAFTEAKLDRYLGELQRRYQMVMPSEAQETDFVSGRSQCLGYASADARVLLIAQQNVQGAGDVLDLIYQSPLFQTEATAIQQCLPEGAQQIDTTGRL